jgi:hypothetical protein
MTRQEWIDDRLATLKESLAIELDLVGLGRASGSSDEIVELRLRGASVKRDILAARRTSRLRHDPLKERDAESSARSDFVGPGAGRALRGRRTRSALCGDGLKGAATVTRHRGKDTPVAQSMVSSGAILRPRPLAQCRAFHQRRKSESTFVSISES